MNSFLFEKLLFSYVTLKFLFSQRFAFCHFWTIIENYLLDHKIKFQLRIENQDQSRNKTRGQKIEWFNSIQLQHCWCFSCCLPWILGSLSKCSQLKSFTQKVASSANHKHANLKTGLMKYLLSVLPIKTSRYHYLGTVEVIVGLNSVYSEKELSGMSKIYSMEYFYK